MPIKNCLPNLKPAFRENLVCNFGFPKGKHGRCNTDIKGIVLHCTHKSLTQVITEGNRRVHLAYAPNETSYHYFIDNEGGVTQTVLDTDIAWGFPSQMATPAPLLGNFDWPLVTANPTIPVDRYVIHIAIQSNPEVPTSCSDCSVFYTKAQLQVVAKLIAYLRETYGILVSQDYIQTHNKIDGAADGECECLDICTIFDLIDCLCRECDFPHDSRFRAGEIETLYGHDKYGCLVAEPIELALQRLGYVRQ